MKFNPNKKIFILFSIILFLIIIIFFLFIKYYYQKKIESFGDYHEFINIPQSTCYYDSRKNEINKNYNKGDLTHDLANCIDYINPGICMSNNLTEQLEYLKKNISPSYYDENINAAFNCSCNKLMNIDYTDLDSKNKKLLIEIQKLKNKQLQKLKNEPIQKITDQELEKSRNEQIQRLKNQKLQRLKNKK
jgi:hypothetical protein